MPVQDRRAVAVDEFRIQLLDALGRIGLEHAFVLQEHQRGRGQAPDHVRLRVVLLRQQLRGDDAGAVAHPFDLDVGVILIEALGVFLEILGLDRGVDRKLGRAGPVR